MNDIARIVSDHEKFHIGDQVEKLFLLQDKPMNEKKKALIVEEIISTGYPYQAIVAGLTDLMREDLRTIKIHTILESIKDKLVFRGDENAVKCSNCDGGGFAVMLDSEHHYVSLACTCAKGERRALVDHIAKWNGLEVQHVNGRSLTRW